jgi:hypothetical protein
MERAMWTVFFLVFLKSLFAVPAAPLQNYCPVVIENNTGQDPEDVYFLFHQEAGRGLGEAAARHEALEAVESPNHNFA